MLKSLPFAKGGWEGFENKFMQKRAFIIGGVSSGAGKTTVTLALMAALKKKGYVVQPFKAGPDYIDSSHHSAVCGRESYNLDTWMMGKEVVKSTFGRKMQDAEVGIIEGVMGLFDGRGALDEEGSTAHLAKTLGLPVILVVDAGGMATSAAALVSGFENFDPRVNVAGIIFNRVGSAGHFRILKEALEKRCSARAIGYVQKNGDIAIPERHLGLVMSGERNTSPQSLAWLVKETVDMEALIGCSHLDNVGMSGETLHHSGEPVTIAVARDEAFCFYYRENLDLLEQYGARLHYFSPLSDKDLPEGTQGIYLGGGYPELHAERLMGNAAMRESIRMAAEENMPLYAECGGLMYLGKSLVDLEGKQFEMTGLFPWVSEMLPRRMFLGYRQVKVVSDSPFLKKGEIIRGHEFHYSQIKAMESVDQCYLHEGSNGNSKKEGYLYKNSLASYVHLHFASNPHFPEEFVKKCREKKENNLTN